MALVIQTNNAAVTAQKNINTNTLGQNKALNRLSSGFRINSAADDAAGFAISSKLDAQGSRLKAAVQNASQATALVKTAEAGVNEIQNMIVRLQTLAIQGASANNAGELTQLDAERSKLVSSIDKIANSTNFNGTNLLNGIDANSVVANGTAATVAGSGVAGTNTGNGTFAISGTATFSTAATATLTTTMTSATAFGVVSDVDLTNITTGAVVTAGTALTTANTGLTFTFTAGTTPDVSGDSYTNATTANGTAYTAAGTAAYAAALIFQVGAENNTNDQVTVNLQNKYTTVGLAITGDLTSATNAKAYITTLKTSLDTLITQRADLGATANQLGFVQANLATSIEQVSASVSSIRDADIAAEIANFTKSQILVQAGTAMLAQANQASKNVLRLFQ
ncbi:MAG: flagellin [Mariprofundaceae bacterium]|nr:flagellin [Mariprofundaceae bacterium]